MMMSKISKRKISSGKQKNKNNECIKKNRVLITVNVVGSPGPLRLLVNQDDTVSTVVDSLLKLYACGGRLPILGSDFNNFLLYPSNAPSDALSSSEVIGLSGERNFVMSKKKTNDLPIAKAVRSHTVSHQAESRSWKSWLHCLNKSCTIISH
ncbi:hypothetical protein LXL04_024461 [Taraxacum kok-saghyz]